MYEDLFAKDDAKIGTNLRIRLPNDFIVRDTHKLEIAKLEVEITMTEAIALGAVAVAVKNPVVSRRFWNMFKC
jgi:hypothetical protein